MSRVLALSLVLVPLACMGKIDAAPDPRVSLGDDGGSQSDDGGSQSSEGSAGSTSTPPASTLAVSGYIDGIAQDDDALYFTVEDESVDGSSWLGRVAKDGASQPVRLTALDSPFGDGVAVDGTTLYWTTLAGTVWRMPKQGGTAEQLAAGQARPSGIAVADGALYWANQGSDDGSSADGSVVALDLATKQLTTLASNLPDGPTWIAADADAVYWADDGGTSVPAGIHRVARSGGTPVTLSSGNAGPVALAAGVVFWMNWGGDQVWSVPVSGGVQTQWANGIASEGGPDSAMAPGADGHSVYWANKDGAVSVADGPEAAPRALSGAVALPDRPLAYFPLFVLVDSTRVFLVQYQGSYSAAVRSLIISIPR
jgi:hypothetical protein